jgi:DNA-binding protein HU-beta
MNKSELIAAVAGKTGRSKKDTERSISALLDTLTDALAADDKVQLVGFGTFAVKERPARTGKNPNTGETVQVAASKVPVFKAGSLFKDAVGK